MVDWAQASFDPTQPFMRGNQYANQLFDQAAKFDAGQKYASGDYQGAAGVLAKRGDFKTADALNAQGTQRKAGAQYASGDLEGASKTFALGGDIQNAAAVTQQRVKLFQDQHALLGQAAPYLAHAISDGHDPAAAFGPLEQSMRGIGTPESVIAQTKQAFLANPQQTIAGFQAMAQKKYSIHVAGDKVLAVNDLDPRDAITVADGVRPLPAGYEHDPNNPGGLAPLPGGPGDPNRTMPPPPGYRNGPNGTQVPITGGPNDPEVKKRDAENRRLVIVNNPTTQPSGADSALDDETARFMAEQAIAGDKSVFTNLGRGAQGAKNVVKVRNMMVQIAKDRGMNGRDAAAAAAEFVGLQSGERTLGTRGAAIKLAADEAETFGTQALQASANVPRGNFVPISRLLQYSESQISDPRLKKLYVATQALINARARAISPTGIPRVEDQIEGRKLLSNADGPEAYKAAVAQMLLEVRTAKAAPGDVKASLNADFTGKQPSASQPAGNKSIRFEDLP